MIYRRKLRYVLVEATEGVNLGDPRTTEDLKRGMLSFLGQLPYFRANPQITAQLNDKVFVISANRGYERNVILALSFIKSLNGKRTGFYTLRTSGTIRSIKSNFRKNLGRDPKSLI